MKFFILFILLGFVIVSANDIKSDVEEIIKKEFSTQSEFSLNKYLIPDNSRIQTENQVQQKFFDKYVYIWTICSQDSLKGYAFLDNTYGKSLPITFLVLFSPSGKIIRVDVVRYREPYGGAIRSRNWLDQFISKSGIDYFRVDKEIDSISGATISVNSVTRGIHKLSILFESIISDKTFNCSIEHQHAEENPKNAK
jgi:Na+-translocating ferredoxin:NAD+ oxidoreductase RnfG subunit